MSFHPVESTVLDRGLPLFGRHLRYLEELCYSPHLPIQISLEIVVVDQKQVRLLPGRPPSADVAPELPPKRVFHVVLEKLHEHVARVLARSLQGRSDTAGGIVEELVEHVGRGGEVVVHTPDRVAPVARTEDVLCLRIPDYSVNGEMSFHEAPAFLRVERLVQLHARYDT